MNYIIILFLARNFGLVQGLGRIQNRGVQMYCEYLNLGRKRCNRPKETAACPALTLVSAVIKRQKMPFSLILAMWPLFV